MDDVSSVHYWNLIFIGAMLMLVVMAYAFIRNRKSKIDPEVTEQATRENYAAEQRDHERDGHSGL